MIVAGVDVGARRVAISIHGTDMPGVVDTQELNVKKSSRGDEIYQLSRFMQGSLNIYRPQYVVIEEPLIGRGVRSSLMVTQTVGGLLSVLGGMQIPHSMVPVATWKKDVIGHGHASKEDIREWVDAHYPERLNDSQDICDAIAIGAYAVQLTERADVLRAG